MSEYPVKDQLVARASDWPGTSSLAAQLHGTTLTARRPQWFFDTDGSMPEEVELVFHRPPGFEDLSHAKWAAKIRAAVAEVEKTAEAERAAASTRVLGRRAVLRQSAFDSPTTHEPRRQLRPRVAAKSKWRRIEALQRAADFQRAYRAAMLARRAGRARVTFPPGTYKLVRLGLVICAEPPS
jgi:hypothetical protein